MMKEDELENHNYEGQEAGKYLTFLLGKEKYGFHILKVQELIGSARITSVPKTPDYLKGVINLRGKVVPIVDLRVKFGLPEVEEQEQNCIIVVLVEKDGAETPVGITVDAVLEVRFFSQDELEGPPEYGSHLNAPFITSLAKTGDDFVILTDVQKIFSEHEIPEHNDIHDVSQNPSSSS